jgi:hypothetical protein
MPLAVTPAREVAPVFRRQPIENYGAWPEDSGISTHLTARYPSLKGA